MPTSSNLTPEQIDFGLINRLQKISAETQVLVLSGLSWIYAMLVLNRWAFVELGERSFGRLWMFYVSWRDFGFTRRSLMGTVLSESRINRLIDNEYVFAFLLWGLLLTFCYVLVAKALLRRQHLRNFRLIAGVILLSPAFLSHLAYATGSLDLPLVVLLVIGGIFVRKPILVSLIAGAGILIHELFIFMIPAMAGIYLLNQEDERIKRRSIFGIAGSSSISTFAVMVFGRSDASRDSVAKIMGEKMPNAAGEHPLWSGYSEISSTTADNLSSMRSIQEQFSQDWLWAVLPCLYVVLLLWTLWRFLDLSHFKRLLVTGAAAFPLLSSLVATDFYRWLSVSAIASLLFILVSTATGILAVPRRTLVILISFSILAPFGGAGLGRPFPLHQEIGAKIEDVRSSK